MMMPTHFSIYIQNIWVTIFIAVLSTPPTAFPREDLEPSMCKTGHPPSLFHTQTITLRMQLCVTHACRHLRVRSPLLHIETCSLQTHNSMFKALAWSLKGFFLSGHLSRCTCEFLKRWARKKFWQEGGGGGTHSCPRMNLISALSSAQMLRWCLTGSTRSGSDCKEAHELSFT